MAITAVLLAAGYATRLYPLTEHMPKALLPLGTGVMLDELYGQVQLPLISRRLLVANHRFAEQFRAWKRQRHAEVEILDDGTTSVETRLGAIRDLEFARVQGRVQDNMVVLGTDNLFRWSLSDFLTAAKRYEPSPSVALWEAPSLEQASQFGVVTLDGASRIRAFVEKSPTPPSQLVATCVYYFPEALSGKMAEFLHDKPGADAPGFFIQWLVERMPVYGIAMGPDWYDIGTIPVYEAVRASWPSG